MPSESATQSRPSDALIQRICCEIPLHTPSSMVAYIFARLVAEECARACDEMGAGDAADRIRVKFDLQQGVPA